MAITVNGVEITDAMIEHELPRHVEAAQPLQHATHELVLRQLLLQEAARLGLDAEDDDARINRVIQLEVPPPKVSEADCQAWYAAHPEAFVTGETVAARHILFQPLQDVPPALLRAKAEGVLNEILATPARFAELAQEHSACPSREEGGDLGMLARGQTVPEFDAMIFTLEPGQIADQLVETQFGLHIIQVTQRSEGQTVPFEEVRDMLAEHLTSLGHGQSLHQFLHLLVEQADIQGVDMTDALVPLQG